MWWYYKTGLICYKILLTIYLYSNYFKIINTFYQELYRKIVVWIQISITQVAWYSLNLKYSVGCGHKCIQVIV